MTAVAPLPSWRVIEVARVVLEFETASIVASGEGDGLHDAVFCTDANGFPALPGDTIAGILRHAMADGADPAEDETCRAVFGAQIGAEGEASRVQVSWAQVHGEDDRPVAFRGATTDPVLAFLAAGVPRDHVRIGPHGAADSTGKFDELLIPAGARFTFELVVDRSRCPRSAADLVGLLQRPEVRMGGGTYHGLGRFRIVRAASRQFDLRDADDRRTYAALPVALEAGDGGHLKPMPLGKVAPAAGWIVGDVSLRPNDTWLIAGSLATGREPQRNRDKAEAKAGWDRFPLTERQIQWERQGAEERGTVLEPKRARYLVPGSAIRGALRHRTAFHVYRQALSTRVRSGGGSDLEELAVDWPDPLPETHEEVSLFGAARDSTSGAPGAISIGDTWLAAETAYSRHQHVSLDRFTQGPVDGLLFDELALYQGEIRFQIAMRPARLGPTARSALMAALTDLVGGRLQLGSGRGHGGFVGRIDWSDGGKWSDGV